MIKLLVILNIIFDISISGLYYTKQHYIIMFISLEIAFLSCIIMYTIISIFQDVGIQGEIFSLCILAVSAAELSIGLALIVLMHKLTGSINLYSLYKK